jgi:hypothetical protein
LVVLLVVVVVVVVVEFDDEQSSAASHVDLEQVVKAISDLVGADYSAKYSVSGFIEYNAE